MQNTAGIIISTKENYRSILAQRPLLLRNLLQQDIQEFFSAQQLSFEKLCRGRFVRSKSSKGRTNLEPFINKKTTRTSSNPYTQKLEPPCAIQTQGSE